LLWSECVFGSERAKSVLGDYLFESVLGELEMVKGISGSQEKEGVKEIESDDGNSGKWLESYSELVENMSYYSYQNDRQEVFEETIKTKNIFDMNSIDGLSKEETSQILDDFFLNSRGDMNSLALKHKVKQ
jgi:hypothetical protein